MNSLIKLLAHSDLGVRLRNFISYRPVPFVIGKNTNISLSDAFLWRTDNGYKTLFRFEDLLGLFYKIDNSFVDLEFYSKDALLLKKITIDQLEKVNEFLINKDLLDGHEGYGTFYIFHRTKDHQSKDGIIIANRCYVGFSHGESISSFVHGNFHVKFQSLDGKIKVSGIGKSSFFNNRYRIQSSFKEFSKSELFFVNPTSKKIKFKIGNSKYNLDVGCSIIIDVSNETNLSILSKCLFLRPIIFNYKGRFFDVYHG